MPQVFDTPDGTLGKDRSRIRTSPGVLARLRSFAFNILPKLRIQALALTRNRSVAEDLVHEAVCNALRA